MPSKPSPLLCELHAHTTWSDGALDVRRLCDLYGQSGFDVLAITDHATRDGDHVGAGRYDAYLAQIEAEAARAATLYGLLVIPGLELTYDDPDPLRSAHAVATCGARPPWSTTCARAARRTSSVSTRNGPARGLR